MRSLPRAVLALVLLAAAPAAASVQRGLHTPPSRQAPSDIARAFAARGAALPVDTLQARSARPLAKGSLVAIVQSYRGLPVVGTSAAIRLDQEGRVRWSRSSLRAIDLPRVTPRLSLARAFAAAGGRGAALRSRLVIAALGGTAPGLAWGVVLPPDLARLELWQVLVDADTGDVIARRNLVRTAAAHRAEVHLENPVATPDRTEVTLTELPAGATRLNGPDVRAWNCVDERQCVDIGFGFYHWCEPGPRARTNAAGNFMNIDPPTDLLSARDLYAELMAYFHTNKAITAYRELIGPSFEIDGSPVVAVANLQFPGDSCAGPGDAPAGSQLMGLDNAFYAPPGSAIVPGIDGSSISMGQGTVADFAYDGDVIYHEIGHGVVYTLAPDLGYVLPHPHGVDTTPGGLVEGLPDYLSSSITGDPLLGEFVGQDFDPETGVIRNLDNDRRCPDSIAGEPHFDGEIIGGSLWEVRAGLPEGDRVDMDRAVTTAIDAMGSDTNFAAFQELVAAELEPSLGASAAESASAIFAARGLVDCGDFVRDLDIDQVHEVLFLVNAGSDGTAPAPVQFRVDFEQGAPSFTLHATVYEGSDIGTPLTLLIKPGDEAIEWNPTHDAPMAISVPLAGGTVSQVVEGPFEGIVHLQLVSPSGQHGLTDVSISAEVEPNPPDAGPSAGGDAGIGGGGDDDEGGCGCRAAEAPGSGALLLLALLLVVRRRRA
jgi:MYXO-CTERM domain-containing protein